MGRRRTKWTCWAYMLFSLLALGCAHSPDRFHPDYASHRVTIQRVLVLPPEIQLLTQIDTNRPVSQARHNEDVSRRTQSTLAQALAASALDVCFADPRTLRTKEMESLQALYRNVNRAIQLHAYGPQLFDDKSRNFDYAVGSVAPLLDRMQADALMLTMGRQTVSRSSARTWVSVAVVEPSGRIIWYGLQGRQTSENQLDQHTVLGISMKVIQPFLQGST